jgi:DNA-directed RNA polymerase specialized sigma24 family protein
MDDQTILKNLRKDVKYLDQVYLQNKEYCLNFMKRKHQDFEAIKDIYQDAIIVLYENTRNPKFELTCSIQTYLNSICRNQLLTKYKENSR